MNKIIILTLLSICCTAALHAQKYPENRFIRGGNRLYDKENFTASERLYQTAFDLNPHSPEAAFNLGNALYKQGRWEDAAKSYSYLLSDTTLREKAAPAFYNAGNAQFQQRQLEQALESYKNALRLNPGDEHAKFNLAYVKKLLENNKNNGGGGGNNDKNKDQQDKDQQNKQDQNNQDQNKQDPGKSDQNKDKQDGQGQQPQSSGMSKEEADQMLEAMQRQEDNTQEKVKAQKAKAVKRSAKNW